jgi:hypothetical protein
MRGGVAVWICAVCYIYRLINIFCLEDGGRTSLRSAGNSVLPIAACHIPDGCAVHRHCLIRRVAPDVSKHHTTVICRVK